MVKVKNSKVNMNTDNTAKFTLQGLFWTFKRNIAASINHSPPNFLYTIRFLGCTAIFVGSPIQLKSIAYTIGVIFTHLCVQNIFSHLINHHIHRSAFVWWSTRMWFDWFSYNVLNFYVLTIWSRLKISTLQNSYNMERKFCYEKNLVS